MPVVKFRLLFYKLVQIILPGGLIEGPGRATEMLNYYTYEHAFQYLDIGYGATLAIALFVLVMVLSLLFVQLRMKVMEVME